MIEHDELDDGHDDGEEHPPVPELADLELPTKDDFPDRVLDSVRRKESMAYMLGFAWGGFVEIVRALAEAFGPHLEPDDHKGETS